VPSICQKLGSSQSTLQLTCEQEGSENSDTKGWTIKIAIRTFFSLCMQETNKRDSTWYLFAGVLAADFGMLLIALGGWDALKTETRILIYVGGSLLFLSGLFLIWMDAIRLAALRHEPALESTGMYLGKFQLNGYLFEAYEREGDNGGKEFRLFSTPPVSPAREAAFIRYIIQEGLIYDLWPQMSKQIEEEANWAFLS